MSSKPARLRFPDDEKRLPWLALLLEIQFITNQGVAAAIKADGRKLACARGCASCCRSHTDIPVYPLELMGITWFAVEKLEGEVRERVRQQLLRHRDLGACPFLVDEACAIHPLRPMACRQFNVFTTVCEAGEDAFHTRRGDVLNPDQKRKNEALREMLRHHGVKEGLERRRLVETGEVHRLAQSLREMRWESLAARMGSPTMQAGSLRYILKPITGSNMTQEAVNKDEVLAATRQWLEKAVIGLNLCPFAKSVYVKNQVRFVVSEATHLDGFLEDLDRELDLLAATDPAEIDTTLLIHPTLLADFEDFNDFTIIAEAAVEEHGLEGVLQVASFHPAFQFADTAPDDISNYTNRSPFPTLHLIREDSIARAVEAYPDAEAIYGRNIETLNKLGIAGWRALGFASDSKKNETP